MDAKEARRRALDITGAKEKQQYADIKAIIEVSVDEGKLQCHAYKSIMPAVAIKLESEGYKIKTFSDQRDGTTVTISW